MRRHDKKIAMKKANILFEQRCNENAFSWDGKYTNEEIEEGDREDYHPPYDLEDEENDFVKSFYAEPENEGAIRLGNDLEFIEDGEKVDEEITNITTDINPETQFFSYEDGKRRMDNLER